MKLIQSSQWYNYKTGEYDSMSETPEDFCEYIPQSPAAQNMYRVLIEMGNSPIEATLQVLTKSLPKKE